MLAFPLVLEEEAAYVYILLEVAVVAEYDVFQTVEVVFSTECEVGRHEEQLAEIVYILRSGNVCEVVCRSVRFPCRIPVVVSSFANTTVITFA